jgi:hypothetical protein
VGNPEIVYNGITLSFPEAASNWKPLRRRIANVNTSHGGITETVRLAIWDEGLLLVEDFEDAAFFRSLFAWWEWANQGEQYAVALDSAKKINLSITGTSAAGQPDVLMSTTTGIVVAQEYLLRSADLTKGEIIVVQSVTAGVKVTATANLKYGYANGDTFRDRAYYPKAINLDDAQPFFENELPTYHFEHHFREDRG